MKGRLCCRGHCHNIRRAHVISSARIAAQPHIEEQFVELRSVERVIPDSDGPSFWINHYRNRPRRNERCGERLYPLPSRLSVGILLKGRGLSRKGKEAVDLTDKGRQVNAGYGSLQISDGLARQRVQSPMQPGRAD